MHETWALFMDVYRASGKELGLNQGQFVRDKPWHPFLPTAAGMTPESVSQSACFSNYQGLTSEGHLIRLHSDSISVNETNSIIHPVSITFRLANSWELKYCEGSMIADHIQG